MKNIPLLVGTILGTLILVVGVALLFSRSAEPVQADLAVLMNNARNTKGPENAKVTIVEFSDLQCPACRGTQPLIEQIVAKYPNDVRLVFRHFPLLSIHPNAQMAAQAAEVAAEKGKFWEYHDLLFAEQDNWAELDAAAAKNKFVEYAEKLQIDKNEFQQRIESDEVRDRVLVDMSDGNKLNVNSTPTFYVNGQKTTAPQLQATVESLLNQ